MRNTKIKLPFGLNENNDLVHISDVKNDEKRKYICPGCFLPLIAAKGNIIQHHFKHSVSDECERGLESAIHLAAKKAIMEKKRITLPEYVSIALEKDSRGFQHVEHQLIFPAGKVIEFDLVQEEKELHGMVADIFAQKNNVSLLIEVYYRHKVDEQKIDKIKHANISAIEINLSKLTQEDLNNAEAFWSYINNPDNIQWLHNAKAYDSIYPKLLSRVTAKIQVQEKKYTALENQEKFHFVQDLKKLNMLRTAKHIESLKLNAIKHPAWALHGERLQLSLNAMPNFLNVEVPNGDWIFGCDRRVWQVAAYNSFICREEAQPFHIWQANNYLKLMCNVPRNLESIERCIKLYPEVIPHDFLNNLPLSWETLRIYFTHLCELGILEFSGGDMSKCMYKILSKVPITY